jgi:TonB family protein
MGLRRPLYGRAARQLVQKQHPFGERILGSGHGLMLHSERHSLHFLARLPRPEPLACVHAVLRAPLALLVTLGVNATCILAQTRPGVVRVEWPAANVLVYPDTTAGVAVWLATNAHAKVGRRPVSRELTESFHPDSLRDWLIYTRQLLALREPLPGDTLPMVSSGVMRGLGGTAFAVGRWRKKNKLDRLTRLVIAPRGEEALLFDLERQQLDTLLDAFEVAASQSAVVVRSSPPRDTTLANRVTVAAPPPNTRVPEYPEERRRHGREGEVWLSFVVGADGMVDPESIVVYLSDHWAFEQSVRHYLQEARYIPATFDGRPVKMLTRQRFVFSIAR